MPHVKKTLTVQKRCDVPLPRDCGRKKCTLMSFLKMGRGFYQDIGCHPEYATPECDDVAELVAHDKAGETDYHTPRQYRRTTDAK